MPAASPPGSRAARRAVALTAAALLAAAAVATADDGAPSPAPEPSEPDPAPYLESDGRVVLEVETGAPTEGVDGRAWLPSALSGAMGSALRAGPDGGPAIPPGAAPGRAPGIAIPVRFSTAGTYHVWVRAWAPDPAGDSLHLGLDGAVQPLSAHLTTKVRDRWNWFGTRISWPSARIVVDAPGEHTVNVWMREDGLHLDRIVLSTDPSAAPEGTGPPESPRSAS